MCLAVPVKILEIHHDQQALVDVNGVHLKVSTMLCPNVAVNDYALVHAGFIIEKLDPDDAHAKIALWDEYYQKTGRTP